MFLPNSCASTHLAIPSPAPRPVLSPAAGPHHPPGYTDGYALSSPALPLSPAYPELTYSYIGLKPSFFSHLPGQTLSFLMIPSASSLASLLPSWSPPPGRVNCISLLPIPLVLPTAQDKTPILKSCVIQNPALNPPSPI